MIQKYLPSPLSKRLHLVGYSSSLKAQRFISSLDCTLNTTWSSLRLSRIKRGSEDATFSTGYANSLQRKMAETKTNIFSAEMHKPVFVFYARRSCELGPHINRSHSSFLYQTHPMNRIHAFQQKRHYIFLPSSFAECVRMLRDTVTSLTKSASEPSSSSKLFIRLRRSQDQVLFKIQQAVRGLIKLRTSLVQQSRTFKNLNKPLSLPSTSSSTTMSPMYQHFTQWKGAKKQRVRDWMLSMGRKLPLQQQTQSKLLAMKKAQQSFMGKVRALSKQHRLTSDERITYYSLVRKSLTLDSVGVDSIGDINKPSSSYYKRKLRSLRILLSHPKLLLYSQHLFTLKEPFEPFWFDIDGCPLTSQDPHTLRYVNPWMSSSSNGWKSLKDVWKWKKDRVMDLRTIPPMDLAMQVPQPIPPHQIDMTPPMAYEPKIKLTWIGHATCLVYISNQFTILTDPMFSKKASPFQKWTKREFLGVPRYYLPAVSLFKEDQETHVPPLPAVIDVCLISHDHYDHLDYSSVQQLVGRVKFWVVPLGIKQWLLDNISGMDASSIVELKWWDHVTLARKQEVIVQRSNDDIPNMDTEWNSVIKITCAPAQHWSSRTPWDRNTRLWCSWAVHAWIPPKNDYPTTQGVKKSAHKLGFFFAGDTARPESFPLHRQIGDRLGPFDLSAIPIGAYEPRFFMRDSHCDPDEAVQIHNDLRSRKSVAIHWGTFPLANEPYWDPPIRLQMAVRKLESESTNLSGDTQKIDFTAIGHGESIESFV